MASPGAAPSAVVALTFGDGAGWDAPIMRDELIGPHLPLEPCDDVPEPLDR